VLYGQLGRELGGIFRDLAEQKESRIEEGHLMMELVPMLHQCAAEVFGGTDDGELTP
jgi:hypothetical protein